MNPKTKTTVFAGGFALAVLFIVSLSISGFSNKSGGELVTDGLDYQASVCITHARGDEVLSHECNHNLLTEAGMNHTMWALRTGVAYASVDYIALCNNSAGNCSSPVNTHTFLENEFDSGGSTGLERAQGTQGYNQNGNWSIVKTFTATADDVVVNKTGLFNASTVGILFAENAFTSVTLQTDDSLTLNWTIGIS